MERFRASSCKPSAAGLREGWGSIVRLSFLLQRECPLTPSLLAHSLLLVNLSNCHLCWVSFVCSLQVKRLLAPKSVSSLPVSSPINDQSPMQCGLVFPEQISWDVMNSWVFIPSPLCSSTTCGLGCGKERNYSFKGKPFVKIFYCATWHNLHFRVNQYCQISPSLKTSWDAEGGVSFWILKSIAVVKYLRFAVNTEIM